MHFVSLIMGMASFKVTHASSVGSIDRLRTVCAELGGVTHASPGLAKVVPISREQFESDIQVFLSHSSIQKFKEYALEDGCAGKSLLARGVLHVLKETGNALLQASGTVWIVPDEKCLGFGMVGSSHNLDWKFHTTLCFYVLEPNERISLQVFDAAISIDKTINLQTWREHFQNESRDVAIDCYLRSSKAIAFHDIEQASVPKRPVTPPPNHQRLLIQRALGCLESANPKHYQDISYESVNMWSWLRALQKEQS